MHPPEKTGIAVQRDRMHNQHVENAHAELIREIWAMRKEIKPLVWGTAPVPEEVREGVRDWLDGLGLRVFTLHIVDGEFGLRTDVVAEISIRSMQLHSYWELAASDHARLREVYQFLGELPRRIDLAMKRPRFGQRTSPSHTETRSFHQIQR